MYVKSLPDIRKIGVLWGRRWGVDKSVDKFKGYFFVIEFAGGSLTSVGSCTSFVHSFLAP